MKTIIQIAFSLLVIVGLTITSCKKEVSGCTDTKATNFNSKATQDDGTCNFPAACETNKTGEVYFINHSKTNSTYDIIWDGVKIATVAPNESSKVFTYPANVQHTLVFRFTNTANNSCNPSTPYLTQCQRLWFDCTG